MFIAVIARNDIVDIYSESMISSGHHLNYKYNKLYNKIDGLGSLVLLLISPQLINIVIDNWPTYLRKVKRPFNLIIKYVRNMNIQWNLSNPTNQGTREMCRIAQDVGKLGFSF